MGFRPALSSQRSLAMVQHYLPTEKPASLPKFLVALVIKKAFELAPYNVLECESGFGLSGATISFIRSFQEDKKFDVDVSECHSERRSNNIHIPKGSILLMVLFNRVIR